MNKQLKLKSSIKVINDYYKAIDKQYSINEIHERELRFAIDDLLKYCASKVDWSYHIEKRDTSNNKIPDATLEHKHKIPLGYFESKDDYTKDLEKEAKKKFANEYDVYRDKNILFWQPKRIIIYQDKEKVFDDNIWQNPTKLIEALELFFNHVPFEIKNWVNEVDKFTKKIPELSTTLLNAISDAKKNNKEFVESFKDFRETCQQAINKNISNKAIDEMFVQHILTKQIYERIFNKPKFLQVNTIAVELQKLYMVLTKSSWSEDDFFEELESFYAALTNVALSMVEFSRKQNFLNTVFERFFQGWAVKTADRLGIVYTPQEVVDFMVRSVDHILKTEFGREKGLGSQGVHIIDPFVGTGNFIMRVMKEIKDDDLPHKYKSELHCNEISLMPYYIACMNIEHEYRERVGKDKYEPFEGICFADTFQIFEDKKKEEEEESKPKLLNRYVSKENTERVKNQREKDIFVVISNPPYNTSQMDENDNNKNRKYKDLEQSIADTYGKDSKARLKNKLYDPYVKAFKWASDRIGDEGIIAMITNNSFIDMYAFDGMRKHLESDFDKVYILDLGGNVRKNPKLSGTTHNVFGIQVGVSINIFIKKKGSSKEFELHFSDVNTFWKKEQKYEFLIEKTNIDGVDWKKLIPNKNYTWLTDGIADDFEDYPLMGDKHQKDKADCDTIFNLFSLGVVSNNDAYVYDWDLKKIIQRTKSMVKEYQKYQSIWVKNDSPKDPATLIVVNPKILKWIRRTKRSLGRGISIKYNDDLFRVTAYRPYTKKYYYWERVFSEERYLQHKFFPTPESEKENKVICHSGVGSNKPFHSWVVNIIPCLDMLEKTQCFPFYTYNEDGTGRKENIADKTLKMYQEHYKDEDITKWDIFYYIYAMLHHPDYRNDFKENLKKSLPRIPFASEFWKFSKVGHKLADIHLDYENAQQYDLGQKKYLKNYHDDISYQVTKMKLNKDKTELIYNDDITLKTIPKEVFDYKLGNRSALEWIIDQYRVKTDKRSGITQDPNNFDGNEKYIFELIGKIVTVSLETVKLVKELSKLKYK